MAAHEDPSCGQRHEDRDAKKVYSSGVWISVGISSHGDDSTVNTNAINVRDEVLRAICIVPMPAVLGCDVRFNGSKGGVYLLHR